MKPYPQVLMADWLGKNRVRVFFSTGRIVELKLPVRSAKHLRIVVCGMGLDPGNGMEISATRLYSMKGKILRKAVQTQAPSESAPTRLHGLTKRTRP